MNDQPDVQAILAVVGHHLQTAIVPAVKGDGGLYYQTLIAINLLKIAARELQLRPAHLAAEWADLNTLLQLEEAAPADPDAAEKGIRARHATLTDLIERGGFDAPADQASLLAYLHASTQRQLDVIGKS